MRYGIGLLVGLVVLMGVSFAYTPTDAEWRLHDRVVKQLITQYGSDELRTEKSQEIVNKMATIDDRLADESIPENIFWLLSTTKWYLLRIIEGNFPKDLAELADYRQGKRPADQVDNDKEPTNQETATDTDNNEGNDEEETNTPSYPPQPEHSPYRIIDITPQGVGYTPSPVTIKQDEEVKLRVGTPGDLDRLYFTDGPQAWRDVDGTYIIDTSQLGSYQYRCAAGCNKTRKGWMTIVE